MSAHDKVGLQIGPQHSTALMDTAPNARLHQHRGVVHRTRWAIEAGRLVAYPACNEEARRITPGDHRTWTNDAISCSRCMNRIRRGDVTPPSRRPVAQLRLAQLCWSRIVAATAGLSQDMLVMGTTPTRSRRRRFQQAQDLYRELRLLPNQCTTTQDLAAATEYIHEIPSKIMDLVLEDLIDQSNAH